MVEKTIPEKTNCPFCGEEIMASAIICRYCNHKLIRPGNSSVKNTRIPTIIFSIISILLLAALIVVSILLVKKGNEEAIGQETIFTRQTEIAFNQATITGYSNLVAKNDAAYSSLSNSASTAIAGRSNAEATRSALYIQVLSFKKTDCNSQSIDINYSSNATVSESLKLYLGDKDGKINTATWDVIWNNSKTSLHKLTGKYLWEFVVYFNETVMGFENMTYDVTGRCFIK